MLARISEKNYIGTKMVNGKEVEQYDMTIVCNGTPEQAKINCKDAEGNLLFQNGCFENKAIFHGSYFYDISATALNRLYSYDEENDDFIAQSQGVVHE